MQTAESPPDAGIAGPPAVERPAPAVPPSGRRRRTAVLAGLVLLVLAGLTAVLVPVLTGGGPDRATGPTATGPAASPTAPPARPNTATRSTPSTTPSTTASTTPSTTKATTAPTPTTAPTAAGPATGSRVIPPPGFTRYTDPADGFSLVLPSGWRPVRLDTRVDFHDPNSSRFLRIDTSDHPLPDPYQNWVDYERQFRQGKTDYHLIGIRRVQDYRPEEGWTTADWEFTLGNTHVLDRNIRVSDARAHAIYWSTPQDRWDDADSRQILRLAEQSFVPAPTSG